MATTSTLPAIKGLFKKDQSACNGWARCTKDKVRQLQEKIEKAGKTGFKLVETKTRRNEFYYNDYMYKYMDAASNVVYLMCHGGMEEDWGPHAGTFTYGNVDIYRGTADGTGYYDQWFAKFAA